ncbi:MAG TPA: L-2-hydroxyglutarate oxidase [Methylomirabilota bacterium]|jgi:L-2-hydroxyglutarate oxidase LhgO|nr:L-2-hydroxyglutarate oxidase [Methylomirabilota bacterium]
MADRYDIAIIGSGIVGLATALAITERFPRVRLVILDKEPKIAAHQTGHNSGVIHSGIYYKPGSYKAKQCGEGKGLMRAFCEKHGIKVVDCGKVIVATTPEELPRLQTLYERGQANGVPVEMIEPERLREIEPHAAGIRAIWSPTTAIVDYTEVSEAMARDLRQRGVEIELRAAVTNVARTSEGVDLWATRRAVLAKRLINCAGLYSDVVAAMAGAKPDVQIVPFRGEYYMVRPDRRHLVRTLIYPVPDPEFPFLGVHFTNTVHGEVEAGPNAVLAFAREGYTFWRIRPWELGHTLTYSGMWRMARKYWKTGGYEMYRSLSKKAFVKALQRLVPEIRSEDIERGGAGIRAQAVAPDGSLVDDFRIVGNETGIHVLNAPSPGATASLSIGRHIAELAGERFGLT